MVATWRAGETSAADGGNMESWVVDGYIILSCHGTAPRVKK